MIGREIVMAAEEQIVSNYNILLETLKLICVGGVGGGIVGIIGKLVIDRRLEALKSQLEKKNAIHKLQFEKEFELYGKFWKALIDVKESASITPMLDIIPEGKTPLDVYKERWEKAANILNDAIDLLYNNLPFYHDNVSNPAKELLNKCRKHLIRLQIILQHGKTKEVDIHQKDEELSKMIIEVVDKIEIVIKKRIGLLQEAELVE